MLVRISIILLCCGLLVATDYYRLDNQFDSLQNLLRQTRLKALYENKRIIVRFEDDTVKSPLGNIKVPFLNEINYDTKLGQNMIVFTGQGTSPYNVRIHGGDMTLKSWFGMTRHIAVNCTGLVTEGVYPE